MAEHIQVVRRAIHQQRMRQFVAAAPTFVFSSVIQKAADAVVQPSKFT